MKKEKIKSFLSERLTGYIIIAIALLGRIIQLIFFFNIRVDGSYQYMAMQNLVHGHGVTTGQVLPSNLSATIYEPLINWPPGYSILLSPFYILTGHNYIAAGVLLDIICAAALILISRAIVKLLDVPPYLINIYTILTSFFIYSFYFIASSDAIAIAFFITAIYLTLSLLKKQTNTNLKFVLLTLFLLICGWIKYLFIPAVFVIPLFLIIKGTVSKLPGIKKTGIYSFMILVLAIGGLLFYQKSVSGSAAYISQPERGFFPEHVLDSYPFLPASIIKPDTVEMLGLNSGNVLEVYLIIHLILGAVLLIYILRIFIKDRFKTLSIQRSFLYLSFLIGIAVVGLLLILSLRVGKEEILPGWFWTYVEEPRYYGLVIVLIHLSLFVFLRSRNSFLRRLLLISILFMSIETLRGIYFNVRRLALLNKEEYSWQYENRFQKFADSIIQKEQQKYSAKKTVVTGSVYFMNHRISLYSHVPVFFAVHQINDPSSLNTGEPVLLLVVLRKQHLADFKPFLASYSDKLAGQFDDFYFYTMYVQPH